MLFSDFKTGPVAQLFAALGKDWSAILVEAESYEELRQAVIGHNDEDVGHFVGGARRYAGVCSSGEYRLLLAVLAFADFGNVADDLSKGRAWQDITRGCDFAFRTAIAACVQVAP